jgi:hypothetical protein
VAAPVVRFDSEKSRKLLPVASSIWIALPILARSWQRVGTGRTDVVAAREPHALDQILIMDTLPQVARYPPAVRIEAVRVAVERERGEGIP